MGTYVIRRFLSGFLLIVLLTFLTYCVYELIPGHPGCLRVDCGPGNRTPPEDLRAADHQLGVDRPLLLQYGRFVWRFIRHGSLGSSWIGAQSVNSAIGETLPVTASIVGGGLLILLLLAVPLGAYAALRPRSPFDRSLLAFGVLGIAIHPFVLAIIFRKIAGNLGLPEVGYCALTSGGDCHGPGAWAKHLVLPWICFALFFLPLYLRMIRVRMLETLGEPWVVTARAKGASEPRVLFRHVLRNALGPVLPMVAADAGTALTAAIYLELVFALPGLGQLAVRSLSGEAGGYDRPMVVGIVATVGICVVGLNVISDVGRAWVDPRVRLRGGAGLLRLPRMLAESRVARIPKPVVAVAALAAVGIAAGFIYTSPTPGETIDVQAPLRTSAVGWHERHSMNGGAPFGAMTIRVTRIVLGKQGWRVDASFTSVTPKPLTISASGTGFGYGGFGLFYTKRGSNGFAERHAATATAFVPSMPRIMGPGRTWTGSFGGTESIPRGVPLYVTFGTFSPIDFPTVQTWLLTDGSITTR
jgi:peptide/nickel transport system permease protein